jgi:hypothetical protein
MAIEHFSNAVKDTKLIDVGALRGFRKLQAEYMKGHGVQIGGPVHGSAWCMLKAVRTT